MSTHKLINETHTLVANAVLALAGSGPIPTAFEFLDEAYMADHFEPNVKHKPFLDALDLATGFVANAARCMAADHAWVEELVSAEDGMSMLHCTRCGMSHDIRF